MILDRSKITILFTYHYDHYVSVNFFNQNEEAKYITTIDRALSAFGPGNVAGDFELAMSLFLYR